MAWCVSGSASLNPSIVLSEKTTPHPKVASARLRSTTVMSHEGLAFLARIEKYRPAGPPPKQTTFMLPPAAWLPPICRRFRPLTQPRAICAIPRLLLASLEDCAAHSSQLRNSSRHEHAFRRSLSAVEGTPRPLLPVHSPRL